MANTSTLADENKTENNLEKFELSRSGRKKSEASNKQRRWRENGGFVVEKRQELYQHSKCNVKQHCHATTQEDSVRELSISIECSISSSKLGQPKCSTESQEKGGLGTGPKPIHHIKSNILKNKTSSKSLH